MQFKHFISAATSAEAAVAVLPLLFCMLHTSAHRRQYLRNDFVCHAFELMQFLKYIVYLCSSTFFCQVRFIFNLCFISLPLRTDFCISFEFMLGKPLNAAAIASGKL